MNTNLSNSAKDRIIDILTTRSHTFLQLKECEEELTILVPELNLCVGFNQNNPYHMYHVFDHILHATAGYQGSDMTVKLALLLHDIGKPACYSEDENGGHFRGHGSVSSRMAKVSLIRLGFDKDMVSAVRELVLFHDSTIHPTSKAVHKWQRKIGSEQLKKLWEVKNADILAHSELGRDSHLEIQKQLKKLIWDIASEIQPICSVKDLALSGKDLILMGMEPGREFGIIQKKLAGMVDHGEIPNTKEDLMDAVSKYLHS